MGMVQLSGEYSMSCYTLVANVFLHEFMAECPGDYVKVYLFGLYAASSQRENTVQSFCYALRTTEEQLFEAFSYFEENGLVRILSKNPLSVSFVPLSGSLAKPRKVKPQKYSEFTTQVQAMLPDRMISTSEFTEYFNIIETYHMQPEALILIIKYCTMLKDKSVSYRDISAVARNWAERGIVTYEACENELQHYNTQSADIQDILRAMGLRSGADFYDSELYTKWTKELGFGKAAILFAARTLKSRKPNMNKLDELLLEFYRSRRFSPDEMQEYLDTRQRLREIAVSVNRSLGEYVADLTPVVENYITVWIDAGFDGDTLVEIAGCCFRAGIKTLAGMDKLVKKLVRLGVLTADALHAYLEEQAAEERFLKEILEILGIGREVNSYDRDSYRLWSGTWGIPDEVIRFAASQAQGPGGMRNLQRIMSQYHGKGVTTVEQAKEVSVVPTSRTGGAKSGGFKDYPQREYSREELSGLFEDVDRF